MCCFAIFLGPFFYEKHLRCDWDHLVYTTCLPFRPSGTCSSKSSSPAGESSSKSSILWYCWYASKLAIMLHILTVAPSWRASCAKRCIDRNSLARPQCILSPAWRVRVKEPLATANSSWLTTMLMDTSSVTPRWRSYTWHTYKQLNIKFTNLRNVCPKVLVTYV